MTTEFLPSVGLEIHTQLLTKSKMFCGCPNLFGAEPNTLVCPVCLGLPGSLPVPNKLALEFAVMFGIAQSARINLKSNFSRKNYFYPDLPKGYQISQYDEPLCEGGHIEFSNNKGETCGVRLNRIHLEEDAGKATYPGSFTEMTLIDFNRCGIPLLEIVTEPELRSGEEAALLLKEVWKILLYLGICDGNLEEGSLRCDANVSVRGHKSMPLGAKTEIKNINSFRNVEKAINAEIKRQSVILATGKQVEQNTLKWNDDTNSVMVTRKKEQSDDYRYFPEPDLVLLDLSPQFITRIEKDLPELPQKKKQRFSNTYRLKETDINILTEFPDLSMYFETAAQKTRQHSLLANWVINEVLHYLKLKKIKIVEFPIAPERLAALMEQIGNKNISGKIAKKVFDQMILKKHSPEKIITEFGLMQINDPIAISSVIEKIVLENPSQVKLYKSGKTNLFNYFAGKIMKETSGKANPELIRKLLSKRLTDK